MRDCSRLPRSEATGQVVRRFAGSVGGVGGGDGGDGGDGGGDGDVLEMAAGPALGPADVVGLPRGAGPARAPAVLTAVFTADEGASAPAAPGAPSPLVGGGLIPTTTAQPPQA